MSKFIFWYREPWVWFILVLLSITVVAGTITLYLAFKHAPKEIVSNNIFVRTITGKP